MSYANQMLPREKVFRDPIHNYIYVRHQVILDLIDTPEFQRLRRVRQMGTASFSFIGAEHSRFTHCLGVYEVARRICDSFQRNFPTQQPDDGKWDNRELLVTLCAALLHDIGHGAYSHTFEHIFHTNHEKITQEIITSPSTKVNKVLKRVSPDFPERVASVINKTYPNPQVVQMISSQCDADRMDYLLRDSYNTGTAYGNFDLTRIIRIMRPYKGGICFDMSGKHTIEDYLIGRMQMYLQVDFVAISRSMEVILINLIKRAKYLYLHKKLENDLKPYLLIPFFKHDFTLNDYLQLDDGVLDTYFIHWKQSKDPILRNLSKRFLNRRPFGSVQYDEESVKKIPEMRKIVEKCGFDPEYYTAIDESFNLPYEAYKTKREMVNSPIQLINIDGSMVELSKASALVRAISGRSVGADRFFFPREFLLCKDHMDKNWPAYQEFRKYINNDHIISSKEHYDEH